MPSSVMRRLYFFDRVRHEVGEILHAILGDDDGVLHANVEPLLVYPQHRVDREHDTRLKRLRAIVADIVHRQPYGMGHMPAKNERFPGGFLVGRFLERDGLEHDLHFLRRPRP